jgi:flagellar hook-basal body complex protein FliE
VKRNILIAAFAPLVLITLLAAMCATTAPAPSQPAEQKAAAKPAPAEKVYEGAGKDTSMLNARTFAIMDAVRKGVIDLIGVANEKANQDKLKSVLYGTPNPNAFINKESLQTLRKDKIGEDYIFEIRVAVNMKAVESTLRANGLLGGEGVAKEDKAATAAKPGKEAGAGESRTATVEGAAKVEEAAAEAPAAEATPEEKRFIARYVNNMTYMVYFNDQASEDLFYMKAAVGIANEYLTSNAMEAVDLDQVEKLKKDQQRVYEEETGESISMIQWIAQKLAADVYVEIDGRTTGESSGGKYYGQANITLKGFEASTGRLLGSQPWNSPRTFSTASEQAARINALQTSVFKAMPIVLEQAKAYMAKALANGLKYELIIQGSSDAKAMSDFRRKLKRKVKDVITVSQTAEETKYSVFLIGSVEDLADAVLDVAETSPGLEGMYQVVLRGKSITFNSGN